VKRFALVGVVVLAACLGVALLVAPRGFGWRRNLEMSPPRMPVRGAAPADPAPDDFYAGRVGHWESRRRRRAAARTSLAESELRWVSTPQDARVALMVSEETGFDAWGIETQVAEIPPGWHTGRHRHGEEAIYVVTGDGIAVVDGIAYDFRPGTTIGIPFGAAHQLYNTGNDPVRYVSATAYPLERHLGLYRMEQLEPCGPTQGLPEIPRSPDGRDPRGRRIRLLWEDAAYRDGSIGLRVMAEAWLRAGVDLRGRSDPTAPVATGDAAAIASRLGHHGAWIRTMGDGGTHGFANRLVVMSGLLIDAPGSNSGRHSHMEAVLYVLAGRGYSVVDGSRHPWEAGTSLHVQGPQTSHQHFSDGPEPSVMLRIASGLRPSLENAVADVFPKQWFEGRGGHEAHSGEPAP
jgi:quercetin dioxygenase-like cupin family protein